MRKWLYSLIVTIGVLLLVVPAAGAASTEPVLDVKLVNFLGNQKEVTVSVKGKYILESDPARVLTEGNTYKISVNGSELCFDNVCAPTLKLAPQTAESYLTVNGREYHSAFTFTNEEGFVRPVNHLFMEDYIKGVVPREMYPSWRLEALKAQAVAARTYAARHASKTLIDGTGNQVYAGYFWAPELDLREDYKNSNVAVDETAGKYVTYRGRAIDAMYSASNGGHTEMTTSYPSDHPYLQAKPDPFDGISKDSIWSFSYNKQQIDITKLELNNPDTWWNQVKEADEQIAKRMKEQLFADYKLDEVKIVSVNNIDFHSLTAGLRFTRADVELEVLFKDQKDEDGALEVQLVQKENVAPSVIRTIFGGSTIMKNNYVKNVEESAGVVTVSGAGFGHGGGLSQYGANHRAEAGQTYTDILGFYYPGTELQTVYTERGDRNSFVAKLNGWVIENGKKYYYTETGAKATGWKQFDQDWYYFDQNGAVKTGWVSSGGKWYYMDSEGKMLTGWQTVSGKKYFLDQDGVMATGWLELNNEWYYLDSSGAMKTGWVKVGYTWYYMNADGVMQTGWEKVNGDWFFLKSSGAMATGWVKDGTKWYYMNSSGIMQTGWVKVGTKWYYMNNSGTMLTGWILTGGQWYYLYSNGSMAANTTIDGYRLGSSGAWIR